MAPVRRSFAVRGCLGRGGFGDVYRARMWGPSGVATEVALKVLRRHSDDGQAARRMRDEGRLLARLDHPAIVKVHDLVVLEGRLALVTELIDGEPLSRCLSATEPFPIAALLEVVARTAEALDAAWTALRLVHRDVKPSNVLVSRHGDVRVLDFGLARSDEMTREAHTRTDLLVGSPAYMAPERFLQSDPVPASDVFSLGATLYEGIVRQRLFDMPVPMAASLAVSPERHAAYVAEQVGRMETDERIVELLRRLLAFEPDGRPTAAEVATRCDDLAHLVSGPSLARWCRARDWTGGSETPGELSGRTLVEEWGDPPPVARPIVPWRWVAWGGGAGVAAVVGLTLASAVAMLTWQRPAIVVPAPPRAVPEIVLVDEPPTNDPVRVEPVGSPPRREVVHTTSASVAPEPPPTAQVVVAESDGVDVALVSATGRHMPGDLPAGAYDLVAHFPHRADPTTTPIVLEPGRTYTVRCERRMFRCVMD